MKTEKIDSDSNIVWLLDNGHGENTCGKRSPVWNDGTQLLEYMYNRLIVKYLSEMMDEGNYNYKIIVPELNDISLTERVNRANKYAKEHSYLKCIYVSVHGNAAGIEKASGIEVFTSPGQTKSDQIATIFFEKAKILDWRMRFDYTDGDPDKESRFSVLTKTVMPAILTETGFYTNEKECRKMMLKQWQVLIASVHYEMIKSIELNNIL